MNSISAVIPAAGLGTRALPNSFAGPKELAPVYDKPAIQWVVEEAINAKVRSICIVISDGKEAIQRYFEESEPLEKQLLDRGKIEEASKLSKIRELGKRICYARQAEPLGLGHAVLEAASQIEGDSVLVTSPDDLWIPRSEVLNKMFSNFNPNDAVIATQQVELRSISQYGCPAIVDWQSGMPGRFSVSHIVEKPSIEEAPSDLAVSGRWLLPSDIFDKLRKATAGVGGEIQLTSALDEYALENRLYAEVFPQGMYCDTGNPLALCKTSYKFAKELGALS